MFEKLLTGFGYWQPSLVLFSNVFILFLLLAIFFLFSFFFPNNASRQRVGESLVANWEESIRLMDDGVEKMGNNPPSSLLERVEEEDFGAHGRRFCLLLLIFICAALWG